MNKEEKTWREIIKKAAAYIALDQTTHYLYMDRAKDIGDMIDIADYPWEFVTSCESGGSHRLDMYTSVRFEAVHPTGLIFHWTYDIEPHSSNGAGHYIVDIKGCQTILKLLKPKMRKEFSEYLKECASKVSTKADEWKKIYEDQVRLSLDLAEAAKA